ncbi:unnamed protein product [Rotaria socialis]|uniref:HAT C-terminal dimerisation domain-containing protein n=1 Tax=Rotaria socialis TaxID=392032 RepID=A0A819WSU5_9BILA|nr:unnamed protein product [Rotaria socialis]CAF4144170.1 unnamed protein product [Rotaria socialis]
MGSVDCLTEPNRPTETEIEIGSVGDFSKTRSVTSLLVFFSVPASSAAVEREFSLAGDLITQKHAKLLPDVVNDMVFNHSFKVHQQGLDNTDSDTIELR